mgnify:CR=1 FL=1
MISILPESNYAAVMTETVEPYLDSRRQEMDMPLSTGGTLHAEVYEQPDATRAVVILHGIRREIPRNDVVFSEREVQRLRHRPPRTRQVCPQNF